MRNSLKNILLVMSLGGAMPCIAANTPVKIIEPKDSTRTVRSATIDTERFQLGAFAGFLAVQDFNTNPVYGVAGTYQLFEDWLLLGSFASSDVGRSTFERREGLDFLSDDQREFSYLNLLGGYRIYKARSFFGASHKFDSDVYLLAGLGNYEFAGESSVGWTLGASYRVVFTDWLVVNLDFKDHIFSAVDVFGSGEHTTQNLEVAFGLNFLF